MPPWHIPFIELEFVFPIKHIAAQVVVLGITRIRPYVWNTFTSVCRKVFDLGRGATTGLSTTRKSVDVKDFFS